jgi:hypothetical protein
MVLRPAVKSDVKFVVKVNMVSSDLIGGYLTLDLNQPIKWADFRLDATTKGQFIEREFKF